MKASEIEDGKVLMIGDLVVGCIETDIVGEATYKIPCKVTDINHYGDVICEALKPFPNELDWHDGDNFSWIEPIPLTPDILEKNGFHKEWDEDIILMVCDTIIIEIGDKYKLYKDGKMYLRRVLAPLYYVHELQHALRLCGIEKTIEL